MVHGRNTFAFIDYLQYRHDTNLTLNCLLKAIRDDLNGKALPEMVFIQLDNCGRENKNKYFLGMMAYLIAKSYAKEIQMSFLMVGHTHEGKIQYQVLIIFSKIKLIMLNFTNLSSLKLISLRQTNSE